MLLAAVAMVPGGVNGTSPLNKPASVPINLLIDYGNGTLNWNNGTVVASTWNFYNVTVLVTNGNIGSIFFASFGSHFVYQINGAGCPGSNPFCDSAWGLWILQGSCWTLSSLGLDQIPVSYSATVGWYLVPAAGLGATPPTGVNCTSVNIDVKPPNDPATINPISIGTISVAILSTPTFNATTQIVTSTLTFGETGTEHSLEFCRSSSFNGSSGLLCLFKTQLADFHPGDTQAILNGLSVSGTPVLGTDLVIVL